MTQSKLDTLKKFLEQDPSDTFTHYAIALEYVNLRQHDKAIAEFEGVIGLDPNYVPAYHQLGLLYSRLGRKDDAVKTFEKGIQIAALVGDTHAQDEMEEALDDLDDTL